MLRKYNQAQKEAIQASDGPVLVIAGAGSGKTSVLIQHIIYLINDKERSISPDNILAVTFTNKAANEMKERLEEIKCSDSKVNDKDFSNIWIGTFHAICARILHKHINYLGFQQSYNIYDKNDSKRLIKKCISMLDIDSKQYQVKTISNIIENSKNKLIDENDFYDNAIGFYNKIISKVYKKYQEELKNNQSLDYSDLIVKTVQLFKKHPD
ncbi:MAG: UvrD-helicase domain-containing protein, partial [Atribacterota bacterium]|nr:UvrD-helicase domain-containing protein [Atribacterota bacterium]